MSDLLKVKVGGKNYLCRWEKAIGSFIYLTYFNNYDSATRTDTPLIGPQTTYSNSLNLNNYTWDGNNVKFACPTNNTSYNAALSVELPTVFSVELVVFATGSGSSSGGSPYGIYDKNGVWIASGCLTNWICLDVANYNIQFKNGAYTGRTYSNHIYVVQNQIYNQFVKCAFVCDNETKVVKCYFNGTLVAIISNSNYDFSSINFSAYKYSSYTFDYSQFCIRKGDCSINEGNNYPIETDPYRIIH
jgi:hypothetical protein